MASFYLNRRPHMHTSYTDAPRARDMYLVRTTHTAHRHARCRQVHSTRMRAHYVQVRTHHVHTSPAAHTRHTRAHDPPAHHTVHPDTHHPQPAPAHREPGLALTQDADAELKGLRTRTAHAAHLQPVPDLEIPTQLFALSRSFFQREFSQNSG